MVERCPDKTEVDSSILSVRTSDLTSMNNPITGYRILIWSEKPDRLAKFYGEVLGLHQTMKLELPDDYGYAFKVGESLMIWIGKHSEIKGRNKEPFRHIFNLYVDDVFDWYEKLKNRKEIQIIARPFITPPSRGAEKKRYCFTFLDPEGNCLQFMNPS